MESLQTAEFSCAFPTVRVDDESFCEPVLNQDNGDESPTFNGISGPGVGSSLKSYSPSQDSDLPNQLSAPYEVPHFPIEQIENKLLMQRQLSSKNNAKRILVGVFVLSLCLAVSSILALIGVLKNLPYLLVPLMISQMFLFVAVKITITDYLIAPLEPPRLHLGLVYCCVFVVITAWLLHCLWVLYCTLVKILLYLQSRPDQC